MLVRKVKSGLSLIPIIIVLLGSFSLFTGETRDVFPFYRWNMFSAGGKSIPSCEASVLVDGDWKNLIVYSRSLAVTGDSNMRVGLKNLCVRSFDGSKKAIEMIRSFIKMEFRSEPLKICKVRYSLTKLPEIGAPDEVQKCEII